MLKRLKIEKKTVVDKRGRTHNYKKHIYIKDCVICNNEFGCAYWESEKRQCCSDKCSRELQNKRKRNRPLSEEHKLSLRKRLIKSCLFCKTEFEVTLASKKKCCSTKCANIYRKDSGIAKNASQKANNKKLLHGTLQKGKNHYNWQGGITPIKLAIYFSKAMKLWRTAIFKRDNYTCQLCKTRKDLRAHHIYYLSKLLRDAYSKYGKDYVRENFSDIRELWDTSNGITLCNSCHRKVYLTPELLKTNVLLG